MSECVINISKKVNSSNSSNYNEDLYLNDNREMISSYIKEDKHISYKEFNEIYQKSIIKVISNNDYVFFGVSKKFLSFIFPDFIVQRREVFTYFTLKFVFLILSIIFYIFSLEGCPKEQSLGKCMATADYKSMVILMKRLIFSLICCALMIVLSKKHLYTIITAAPIYIFLLFFYDNGTDLYNHGFYNRIFFLITLPLSVCIMLVIKIAIIGLFRNFKKTLSLIIIAYSIFYLAYYYLTLNTCDYWDKGFKKSFIDDSISSCKTMRPEICWFKILDGTMDLPKYLGQDCSDMSNYLLSKDLLISNSNLKSKNSKFIGFPRTENWDTIQETSYWVYQKNILKNLVDLEDIKTTQETIDNTEFTIDFRNSTIENPFEAKLILKKNYTLEEERLDKELKFLKNNEKPLFKNIFILFTDSLSQAHFRRKLPKTFKYLEERYYSREERKRDKNNNSRLGEITRSYQFLKFHAQSAATIENIIPLLFGKYKKEKGVSFFDHHKNAGYVIGTSNNFCSREMAEFDSNSNINIQFPRYDHEFNQIMCDPNLHSLDQPYSIFKGPYSMSLKCIWGKKSIEWTIDYAKQFFSAYRNNSKLYILGNMDSHEGSGEVIKYDDDIYLNYLKWLEEEGFMKDTLILLYSDHGFRMPGYLYGIFNFDDYNKEVYLPAVFMLIPTDIKGFEQIDHFMMENENKFMLPWDLYNCFELNVNNEVEYDFYQCPFFNVIEEKDCLFWELKSHECKCIFDNEQNK